MGDKKRTTGHGPTDRREAANDERGKTAPSPGRIRVRATRTGYYEHVRRREGDVFDLVPRKATKTTFVLNERGRRVAKREEVLISPDAQFSEVWMEEVGPRTPLAASSAQTEIRRQHDETLALRTPGVVPGPGELEEPAAGGVGSGTAATGDDNPLGAE